MSGFLFDMMILGTGVAIGWLGCTIRFNHHLKKLRMATDKLKATSENLKKAAAESRAKRPVVSDKI
jgi:hypothetical protein